MNGKKLYFLISLAIFVLITLYGINTGKLNVF
jgi:hypothetical protein